MGRCTRQTPCLRLNLRKRSCTLGVRGIVGDLFSAELPHTCCRAMILLRPTQLIHAEEQPCVRRALDVRASSSHALVVSYALVARVRATSGVTSIRDPTMVLDAIVSFVSNNPMLVFVILFMLYKKWQSSQPWPDFGG